ncbi:MAG: ATP-binding protein [Candidatus Eisenbacteria bacterium]
MLLGWQFGSPLLKSIVPGLVAMNPATALGFILSGLSLRLLHSGQRSGRSWGIGQACAWAVVILGCLKVVGVIVGWDSGIDRLLFSGKLSADASLVPNRMAPNTALNFVLVGLALLTLNVEVKGGHRPSKYFALVPLLLSLLALTGYAYDVRSFYGLSSYIPMALNTALTFLLISTGILLAHPDRGLTRVFTNDDLGGSLARRLFPFAVGALLVLGWLRLQGERLGLYDAQLGVSLTVFVSSVLMGAVIWTSAHSLSRADADRRRAADALRSAHDGLELRVQERTAQLWNVNRDLEREIAEREQAEAALRASEEQLRQAQKMEAIGRLAGGVAHDFNNMLTAIMGYSQLIRLRMSPHDPAYGNTEEIEKAATRAASLTRQLLAFSRQQVLQPRVLDLNVLIGEIDKMLRRVIGSDIDLLTAPGPSLGRVKVDPGQVEQVLLNLVVNARDAMPRGGKITIETANVELDETYARGRVGVRAGRYVLLAVSDTGCGIDSETQSRIFEPFFTTKEAGKGTGLGLSTVYGIVKQSDGHIEVYSEPGRGAAFKIYLPVALGPLEVIESLNPSVGPRDGSETVLVVEDEDLVRAVIRKSLELHGYKVIEARDGREGLDLLERDSTVVDLIVTDVMLPQMSGLELAQRAARLNRDLKVLYISGYTDKAIVHQGVLAAGAAYLQKPFVPDALARKVREVLDGARTEAA